MSILPEFGSDTQSSHDGGSDASGVFGNAGGAEPIRVAASPSYPDAPGCSCVAQQSHLLKTVGWITAALGAVAFGLIVGRELRKRYKFNRQTPYDLYAHSGDELDDADYFVGI